MKHVLARSIVLLALAPPVAHGCAGLEIRHAWIREPPPTASVAAGFMELLNASAATIAVVAVDSTCCRSAAFHRTVLEDGRARMLPEPVIRIPAHGREALEPGGLHIMLHEPVGPLLSGERIALEIRCASGEPVTAMAVVRRD